jgi:NAD(P)-dependent dehydrogenase (short-subunit alcohol dehydrogenase family)
MGAFMSAIDQNFPPKAKWGVDDIPDLSGKVALVTGGNCGIGRETVKALLAKKATVYMAGRDEAKCKLAIEELQKETSQTAQFLQLDLADLGSINKAAAHFRKQESELHILINNGGVMVPPAEALTADGYDLQFGTNALGHYYLTTLLLPALEAAAHNSESKTARVVTVSSAGYTMHPKINWDSLKDGPARKKMKGLDLYSQSKFANMVFSSELAKRFGHKGIVSTSCHPGIIVSNLMRNIPAPFHTIFSWFCYDTAKGALTQLYAATSPQAATANGKYFIPWARPGPLLPQVVDPETGAKLWTYFEEQTKAI